MRLVVHVVHYEILIFNDSQITKEPLQITDSTVQFRLDPRFFVPVQLFIDLSLNNKPS